MLSYPALPNYLNQNKTHMLGLSAKPGSPNLDLNAWASFFSGNPAVLADLATISKQCGNTIERTDVMGFAKSALSLDWADIRPLFLAIMIWGYGNWQIGKIYAESILAHGSTQRTLTSAIQSVRANQIVTAYASISMPHFRSAYFTKFLYFVGGACGIKPLPLILDLNVAKCLDFIDKRESCHLLDTFAQYSRNGSGVVNGVRACAARYMNYINSVDSWAAHLGCAADDVECFLYRDRGRHSTANTASLGVGSALPATVALSAGLNAGPSASAPISAQAPLPVSNEPIRGLLKKQLPPSMTWEFVVSNTRPCRSCGVTISEVNKLRGFPIKTSGPKKKDPGIGVTLIDKNQPLNSCVAAFHGYDQPKHFYVGNARRLGQTLDMANRRAGHFTSYGDQYKKDYENFLTTAFAVVTGTTVDPTPVMMEFKSDNEVYVCVRRWPEKPTEQ